MKPMTQTLPRRLHALGLSSFALVTCAAVFWSADSAAAKREPLGETTKAWMTLQKEQKPQASESISGEQAQLIWERHVKSFGREIPETMHDRSAITSGD